MSNPARNFNTRIVLWLVLTIPLVIMCVRYISGDLYYGEFIHATGEFSARLLIVTLAVTPLRMMFSKARWTAWLLQNRRYFGVAAFAYAVPHLLAYLWKLASLAKVLEEGAEPGMWTGWIALIIFLPLAITSNNYSVRKLGRRWKTLHRLVYLAAVLTFVHWILVAFDPLAGIIHAGVLFALEAYRVLRSTMVDMNKVSIVILLIAACISVYAGEADVIDVKVSCNAESVCRFDVTVKHADEGWKHYANRWEVVSPDGELLATRELAHPHDNEQPFTRSLTNVVVPEKLTEVVVRAHDLVHEFGGKEFVVTLPD